MRLLRKALILIHRYLGILLSLLFLVWFISGIAMIYARGMPDLTPQTRIERMPDLELSSIRLTLGQALRKAELGAAPSSVELLTVLNRPAYRFDGITVFADTGEMLDMTPERAAEAARLFVGLPEAQVRPAGVLTAVDQWTIGKRGLLPLHKFTVDDGSGTEVYVSEVSGEVAGMTTRGSRTLAWVAAIPHWLYFRGLRTQPLLWRNTVLWLSGIATRDQSGEEISGLLAPYDELVKKISVPMIQDAAKKYFDTKNYARFVLLPEAAPPKP